MLFLTWILIFSGLSYYSYEEDLAEYSCSEKILCENDETSDMEIDKFDPKIMFAPKNTYETN